MRLVHHNPVPVNLLQRRGDPVALVVWIDSTLLFTVEDAVASDRDVMLGCHRFRLLDLAVRVVLVDTQLRVIVQLCLELVLPLRKEAHRTDDECAAARLAASGNRLCLPRFGCG